VRATERACPFCRSTLSSALAAKAVPGSTQRLSRAAAFTFAATLAATGCSSDPAPADASVADTGTGTDTGVRTDTGATTDTGVRTDTGVSADAGFPADDGGFLAMYGGPPQDSGVDSGAPDDNGGVAPLYGLPAVDAGQADDAPDGSIGIRYGSPPRPDAGA
jgi:hypothetical protein